jgi:hypothetical protein
MVRRLKTSHAGAAHQYAPQEQYHDFHDGDTDEEIVMEPAPVAAPDPIMVSDDEESEEVNPEEGEPADQPNQEEQAPGEDLEDHHGPEVEEEEQEQDEAAEEVSWDVYHYRVHGVGIPMADHLRAMVLCLGYEKAPINHCELWTHPWFEPHWEVAAILEEYVACRGAREISKHHDVTHRTTMDAGIAEAARRMLYVLSHKERDRFEDTDCRYTPFRASGEAKIYITSAPAYEGTLNNVRSLLATVNTTLDDTNNTLYVAQQQIFTLELQKRALEAALQNREQPVVHDAMEPCTSPSSKRPRYDSLDARTDAMSEENSP